jgi:hypothetical protein
MPAQRVADTASASRVMPSATGAVTRSQEAFAVPKGPKGQKRHADTAKNAVLVMQIAIGETEDVIPSKRRLGGVKGGKARAAKLSSEDRKAIGRKAARARWARGKGASS